MKKENKYCGFNNMNELAAAVKQAVDKASKKDKGKNKSNKQISGFSNKDENEKEHEMEM
ncbi:MAG: hypothetical protein LBP70_00150 [Mycoplasmataceae bacterium]|jgi:hypothetical protein|nr:hypothetical protein [Mycoplasmataceae bacterium]